MISRIQGSPIQVSQINNNFVATAPTSLSTRSTLFQNESCISGLIAKIKALFSKIIDSMTSCFKKKPEATPTPTNPSSPTNNPQPPVPIPQQLPPQEVPVQDEPAVNNPIRQPEQEVQPEPEDEEDEEMPRLERAQPRLVPRRLNFDNVPNQDREDLEEDEEMERHPNNVIPQGGRFEAAPRALIQPARRQLNLNPNRAERHANPRRLPYDRPGDVDAFRVFEDRLHRDAGRGRQPNQPRQALQRPGDRHREGNVDVRNLPFPELFGLPPRPGQPPRPVARPHLENYNPDDFVHPPVDDNVPQPRLFRVHHPDFVQHPNQPPQAQRQPVDEPRLVPADPNDRLPAREPDFINGQPVVPNQQLNPVAQAADGPRLVIGDPDEPAQDDPQEWQLETPRAQIGRGQQVEGNVEEYETSDDEMEVEQDQ